MTSFWVNQFYLLVFVPALLLAFFLSMYPIRRGLNDLLRTKGKKLTCIVFYVGIVMVFLLPAPLFMTDVIVIMTHQQPQIIVDKEDFDFNVSAKDLMGYLAVPLVSFYIFHNIKSTLAKEGFLNNDNFSNNIQFASLYIGIPIAVVVIAGGFMLE